MPLVTFVGYQNENTGPIGDDEWRPIEYKYQVPDSFFESLAIACLMGDMPYWRVVDEVCTDEAGWNYCGRAMARHEVYEHIKKMVVKFGNR